MFAVVQINYDGIDGLEYQEIDRPEIKDNAIIIKTEVAPVNPLDVKIENHAFGDWPSIPRTIGWGGVGEVVEVGKEVDQSLLNKRVFFLRSKGSFQDYSRVTRLDHVFELPANVKSEDAATFVAGPEVAFNLKQRIDQSTDDKIVITGANSVVGMYLLQLMKDEKREILPIVSPSSKDYLQSQFPEMKIYTTDELGNYDTGFVVDTAGSGKLMDAIFEHFNKIDIASIAMDKYNKADSFESVSEGFDREDYRQFIQMLSTGELKAAVDKVYPKDQTKEAQHYTQDNHSRGRVLVSFK